MLRKITGIIIIFLFLSCSNEAKKIDIELIDLHAESEFSLDTFNSSDWDSLYILKPYQQIDTNRYNISESVLNRLKNNAMIDTYCSLLFFKGNQLVNYSFIPRSVADFSKIEGKTTFPSNQKFKLNDERIVFITNGE